MQKTKGITIIRTALGSMFAEKTLFGDEYA
jgi:hypothetical protein